MSAQHTPGPRVVTRANGSLWWADGGLVETADPMSQFRVVTSEFGTRYLHNEEHLGTRLVLLPDAAIAKATGGAHCTVCNAPYGSCGHCG